MKVLSSDQLPHNIDSNYSFPFLKSYSEFCRKYERSEVIFFFSEENQSLAPAKLYNIKFLKLLRFLFPPLRDGMEIPVTEEKSFLQSAVQKIRQEKLCHRIVQPENFCLFRCYPENSMFAPFGSYRVNLLLSMQQLESNLRPKTRNAIKNAIKLGPRTKEGKTELTIFYALYKQMSDRKGLHADAFEYYKSLYESMGEQYVLCRNVYMNDVPIGGIFILYSLSGAYYISGGSTTNTMASGLIKFLHWDTMMTLKEKGVKVYDFVGARVRDVSGTPLEGVQGFKSRFGGELEKGFLWKMDIDKKQCKLFDTFLRIKMALKGKKPLPDIIDQEIAAVNRK